MEWHVKVGQDVKEYQGICLVQSDKATAEITSPYQGTIKKLFHNIGDMVKVGGPLVEIQLSNFVAIPVVQVVEPPQQAQTESAHSLVDNLFHFIFRKFFC